jgi:hypothetical protein
VVKTADGANRAPNGMTENLHGQVPKQIPDPIIDHSKDLKNMVYSLRQGQPLSGL